MNKEETSRIKGRDFYIEGPFQVTKREFHVSRGYCCDSGCRHCPYQSIEQGPRIITLSTTLTSILLAAGANLIAGRTNLKSTSDLAHKFENLTNFDSLRSERLDDMSFDYIIFDNVNEYRQVDDSIKSKSLLCKLDSLENLKQELERLSVILNIFELQSYARRVNRINQLKGSNFHNQSIDNFDLTALRSQEDLLEDKIFF